MDAEISEPIEVLEVSDALVRSSRSLSSTRVGRLCLCQLQTTVGFHYFHFSTVPRGADATYTSHRLFEFYVRLRSD